MDQVKVVVRNQDDVPNGIIENPDSVRDKIGKDLDLKKFFSAEKIKKAQNIISDTYEVFHEDIIKLVMEADVSYNLAASDPKEAEKYIARIAECAFSIKGKSETIGNTTGFTIAKSLYDYTFGLHEPDNRKLMVIRKHLDLLGSNFINRTQSLPVESIIMQSLTLLIEKIGR